MDEQAKSYTSEWVATALACETLGLSKYKLTRLMGEAGVKRYKLAARDMRTWYLKADDLDCLREALEEPREASLTRAKAS